MERSQRWKTVAAVIFFLSTTTATALLLDVISAAGVESMVLLAIIFAFRPNVELISLVCETSKIVGAVFLSFVLSFLHFDMSVCRIWWRKMVIYTYLVATDSYRRRVTERRKETKKTNRKKKYK